MKRDSREPGVAIEACASGGAAVCRRRCVSRVPMVAGSLASRGDLYSRSEHDSGPDHLEAARSNSSRCRNRRRHHGKPDLRDSDSPLSAVAHSVDTDSGSLSARVCGNTRGPREERAIRHGRSSIRPLRLTGCCQSRLCLIGMHASSPILAGGYGPCPEHHVADGPLCSGPGRAG